MVVSQTLTLMCLFFSSRRRHTRFDCDWSSDVCSSDLETLRRLVEMGGDFVQRRKFVLDAAAGMAVDAVLEILKAAADTSQRTISHSLVRSEERRVGEEGRSRWAPDH